MPQRPLPPTLVAFNGGLALYAGEEVDLADPLDVELGLTGQYKTRNFELTGKHFEQMIKNHGAAGVDPAIDREHESWFSLDAKPALGWVKSLDIAPSTTDKRRSALVGKLQLNDLGQAAVKGQHFRYVSMGFDKAGKHRMSGEPIGAVLDHLALVKNPFIQGMRPLSLALSSIGRLIEEDPMEQLAQKLRGALGLSADASEEQIIVAYEALRAREVAQVSASADALKSLDEQKRINARLEVAIEQLSKDSEARKADGWKSTVAAAVAEFRLTPAEAAEHEKLAGAERDVAGRLLALRQPNKPAPAVKIDALAAIKGTDAEGLTAPQAAEVEAFKKANPGTDDAGALIGAMTAKPELFATVEG